MCVCSREKENWVEREFERETATVRLLRRGPFEREKGRGDKRRKLGKERDEIVKGSKAFI